MKTEKRVVVDLGGTNLRIALAEQTGRLQLIKKIRSPADMSEFGSILHNYISDCEVAPDCVVLAVAGPVSNNQAVITNCNQQVVDGKELTKDLMVPCYLINDFAAQVHGCAASLRENNKVVSIKTVQTHKPSTMTVIGPGTGLGVGVGVYLPNQELLYLSSEGGHSELSHPDPVVREKLYGFLRERLGIMRVSMERVLSGAGIVALYDFFYYLHDEQQCPTWRAECVSDIQLCKAIFSHLGRDPGSDFARDYFLSIMGCFAGDSALYLRSDIVLVGNILGALQSSLSQSEGPFLRAFMDKGVLTSEVAKVQILGIFDDDLGLLGAAHYPIS